MYNCSSMLILIIHDWKASSYHTFQTKHIVLYFTVSALPTALRKHSVIKVAKPHILFHSHFRIKGTSTSFAAIIATPVEGRMLAGLISVAFTLWQLAKRPQAPLSHFLLLHSEQEWNATVGFLRHLPLFFDSALAVCIFNGRRVKNVRRSAWKLWRGNGLKRPCKAFTEKKRMNNMDFQRQHDHFGYYNLRTFSLIVRIQILILFT